MVVIIRSKDSRPLVPFQNLRVLNTVESKFKQRNFSKVLQMQIQVHESVTRRERLKSALYLRLKKRRVF